MRQFKGTILSLYLSIIVVVSVAYCGTTDKDKFEITKIVLDKKVFQPKVDQIVNIDFETTQDCEDIKVDIYDRLGKKVITLNSNHNSLSKHQVKWDGKSETGKQVEGNIFLYVIRAKSKTGDVVLYNPANKTGGFEMAVQEFIFDRNNKLIEYVLPKACMVRIRAGLADGMLAANIMDWTPYKAGRHKVQWDGKDHSGLFDLLKHPDLELNLTCYSLPDNTIIVAGTPSLGSNGKKNEKLYEDLWGIKGKYLHYRHHPTCCHEPKFVVFFPKSKQQDNIPYLSGKTPVRIKVDEKDSLSLISSRFEVIIYLDGVFLFEVEEGSVPFTFYLDSENFKKGPHILTVNIMSYDDHIGVVSKKIIIGE